MWRSRRRREFARAAPKVLFEGRYGMSWDVDASDQRFLMIKPPHCPRPKVASLSVVLNWFEELRHRVPFPSQQAESSRGLARLGRLRAVLRLGERADARPARRAVLAAARAPKLGGVPARRRRSSSWAAAPAASRFRSRARASRSSASIDRRRCSRAPRRASGARAAPIALQLVRGDIRHLPFPDRIVSAGHRALRHPAVAAARARSRRDARGGGARARAAAAPSASSWWPICRRGRSTRSASACAARAPSGARITLIESVRQDPRQAAHALRSGVRRAARAATKTPPHASR